MSWTREQRLAAIAAALDVWAAKWAEHFTPAKDGGTDGTVSQYPEGGLDVDCSVAANDEYVAMVDKALAQELADDGHD
jgi:hypothetical protein